MSESRPLFGHCPPGRQALSEPLGRPTDQRQGIEASRKQESDRERAAAPILLTVVRVALRPDRVHRSGLGQAFGVANREILHAPVRVMNQPVRRTVGRGRSEPRSLAPMRRGRGRRPRPGGLPADDHPRVDVGDERDVDEPCPGADVGQVGDPKQVRGAGAEAAIDEIPRTFGLVSRYGRELRFPAHDATQTEVPHRSGDGAARNLDAFAVELRPDLVDAVDTEVVAVHPRNLGLQLRVTDRPGRRRPGLGGVVGARGELQHATDRLDPVLAAVLVDVGDHLLVRPSSSVAKKSDADFKISFALRSSRFSRSSSFSRARSSEVTPARRPSSTSTRRTQMRNVSAVQPIFAATETIAAHCDSCSC